MQLKAETIKLLEDIERRIDCDENDRYLQKWDDFVHQRFTGELFSPTRTAMPTNYEYQNININDAILDYELMLVEQMEAVSKFLANGKGFLNVRTNYGTGILPSLFGAEIFTMPRHTNTLPTAISLKDEDKLRELVEKGIPDLNNGYGRNVFEMAEFFMEAFSKYPNIAKCVNIFHPDTQGPLDVCELLWGSDMFYALYDDEEFVHDVLGLVTDTYIKFMDKWYDLVPEEKDWSSHWGSIAYRGKLLIRNDSAMNLSPDMYDEFAKKYDAKLIERFGGAIHFCGRGDHYVDRLATIPNLSAINMSQPHLNDMETIYKHTVDKNIQIVGLSKKWITENDIRNGDYKHNISVN